MIQSADWTDRDKYDSFITLDLKAYTHLFIGFGIKYCRSFGNRFICINQVFLVRTSFTRIITHFLYSFKFQQ